MKRLIFLFTLLIIALSINAQKERKFIREGNSVYEDKDYLDAEINYRKALEKNKDSFEAQFNIGDALFKQEKFDKAAEQFEVLAETNKENDHLAKVYHNLGNSQFALKEYEKSIDSYKKALKLNPDDNETRYNLIAAMKMLQQQKDKKKDQNKDKKDKDKKDQNKDKDKKDQQKQDQNKDKDKDKQKQNQDQQQQKQDQQKKKQQQQQQQNQQMSEQDAQRLLNAIQQDENELQKKLRKAKSREEAGYYARIVEYFRILKEWEPLLKLFKRHP